MIESMSVAENEEQGKTEGLVPKVQVRASQRAHAIGRTQEKLESVVEVRNFNLWYGKTHALKNINIAFPRNCVTAIIGPSGCGKSTLLRSINRMNDLIGNIRTTGEILLGGNNIYAQNQDIIALRKHCGMVFQKSNPFPKSIFENVVYPNRIAGERDKNRLREICESSLRRAGLWDEVHKRLNENGNSLSGGQQQRLCIARAIANEPDVLLMDEPCSALDPIATGKVEQLILELRQNFTVVIVTHNMQQAARVSDFTAFMLTGDLIEFAPTDRLFTKPQKKETEDYITGRFG